MEPRDRWVRGTYLLLGRHGRALKRRRLVEGGRRPAGWESRDEEQQPGEIAAGIAAIVVASCSSSSLVQRRNLFPNCVLFSGLLALYFAVRRNRRNLNVATGRGAYLTAGPTGELGEAEPQSMSRARRGDASCRPTRRPHNLQKRKHCTTAKHMAFAHASEFTYLQASCKLLIFVDCSFLCYVKFLKLFHGPMCSL